MFPVQFWPVQYSNITHSLCVLSTIWTVYRFHFIALTSQLPSTPHVRPLVHGLFFLTFVCVLFLLLLLMLHFDFHSIRCAAAMEFPTPRATCTVLSTRTYHLLRSGPTENGLKQFVIASTHRCHLAPRRTMYDMEFDFVTSCETNGSINIHACAASVSILERQFAHGAFPKRRSISK